MAELHRAGRYDRLTNGLERITPRPSMGVPVGSMGKSGRNDCLILAETPPSAEPRRERQRPT
jgi:hypothetical protein